MSSIRELAFDLCVDTLNASLPAGIPASYRSRGTEVDLSVGDGRSIVIYQGESKYSDAGSVESAVIKVQTELIAELRARADQDQPADLALDPLYVHAMNRLLAIRQPGTLWGVTPVEAPLEYVQGAEFSYCKQTAVFLLRYQQKRTNAEAWA